MEVQNTQNSALEQKIFEIPVTCYEEDLDSELSKDKKKDILDLFKNHNKLNSKHEFDKISVQLHFACQQGDVDLIKILLLVKISIIIIWNSKSIQLIKQLH